MANIITFRGRIAAQSGKFAGIVAFRSEALRRRHGHPTADATTASRYNCVIFAGTYIFVGREEASGSGGLVFDAIKNFVNELADGGRDADAFEDHELRLATAALLVHAAAVDGQVSDAERDKLCSLLKQRFGLDDAAASELIDRAAVADERAVDLYHFTRLLNDCLDDTGRLRMIEMMWSVAYADGEISEYESNLIWRVADLLGVSTNERIALRERVAAQRT
jgi:uncharacterized tellurite resistance protein B-like protein